MPSKSALPKKVFGKYKKPLVSMPNLVKDQIESFTWLIEKGLKEANRVLKKGGKFLCLEFGSSFAQTSSDSPGDSSKVLSLPSWW